MRDSPVEQIRAAVDVVDLIGQYVTLKKAGRTFKALCPFHTEKTPSFVVFPDTGHWHCFGCGEGGDVFTFLMKAENLTFVEALRRLADRIGIVLAPPSREADERKAVLQRLYSANEAAAVYFHGLLLQSPAARQYVRNRGITDRTLQEFLLGLAPDSLDAMQRQLVLQGFSLDELLAAGLLYEPESGPLRDRFRARLMFPIRDAEGRIVSFGARGLRPDAVPKYLNGPQTELFDKGSTLFGLFQGASAIKKAQRAVIVEGYVDVVMAHQAGFENVVATLGTSITERQLRQLARLAPEICLALDPDAAGQHAALRSVEVARTALAASVPVLDARGRPRASSTLKAAITIATLPDGLDPDELIVADPARWESTIAGAQPVIDHALKQLASQHDLSSAQGKREACEAVLPLLLDIPDPVEQAHYVELTSQELGLPDSDALRQELRMARPVAMQNDGAPIRPATERPAPSSSQPAACRQTWAGKRPRRLNGAQASRNMHLPLPWRPPSAASRARTWIRGTSQIRRPGRWPFESPSFSRPRRAANGVLTCWN